MTGQESKMPSYTPVRYRAPKRRIERRGNVIYIGPLSNVLITRVMHTCEDSKTLVRIRGSFRAIQGNAAVGPQVGVTIAVRPGGSAITQANASFADSLDRDVPDQELYRWTTVFPLMTAPEQATVDVEFDSKAMRKLKVGDEIVLTAISSNVDSAAIAGSFYLWFKE